MAERMRSPLGRVHGLGSARSGVGHWWAQRLTAVALVPLSIWWVASIIGHAGAGYAEFVDWVRQPVPGILLILMIGAGFYHAALGLQEVIEDYVHHGFAKLASLIAVKFGCILVGFAGIYSVMSIAFEG